jgi:60 kDa SS-A/Ro ribonucleoprotein
MAKNYSRMSGLATRKNTALTPQTERANEREVQNSAGGYVFQVDKFQQLKRWLVLSSTGGTFYISEKKLTKDNAKNICDLFKNTEDGLEALKIVKDYSISGKTPKVDTILFTLALASSCENPVVRATALDSVGEICRTASHLFTYISFVNDLRGWGRGLRNAIADWYLNMPLNKLSYQVCKYPQRRVEKELPWSHRDLLRKIHLVPTNSDMNKIMKYVVEGRDLQTKTWVDQKTGKNKARQIGFSEREFNAFKNNDNLKYIWAHEEAKNAIDDKIIVKLIENYNISRESIPNTMFTNDVWFALLNNNMPLTAMIRNIRNMTKSGVLAPLSNGTRIVVDTLGNRELLHKSRIHPLNVLAALNAYAPSHFSCRDFWYGGVAETDYTPVPQIVDVLEEAFYASFDNIIPTNQNILIAIDVSGSMTAPMSVGIPGMSCCMGAAAMAMVLARTEKNSYIMGFADTFRSLGITTKDTIQSVMSKAQMSNFGATDAAVPATWALKNKVKLGGIVTLSDMESWFGGHGHPYQAMNRYRKKMGLPNTKAIAVGMTSNNYTIADNNDCNSLDAVGFSTDTPQIISDFIRGDI